MPSKRGSKVAAAQARAKAAAKKRARQGGPALPAAAYVKPPEETAEEQLNADQASLVQPEPRKIENLSSRPQAVRAIGMRRERHATPTLTGASLKRELAMIGTLTALSGIVLAVLRLATDLGA